MHIQKYALFSLICLSNYADYQLPNSEDQISYVFSHGLIDNHGQAFPYLFSQPEKPYILNYPLITFDYPHASTGVLKINRLQSSLAQDNEIERLAQVSSSYLKDKKNVLVGVSCGASTIINFVGRYNPSNVLALVLESPFDCVENIAKSLIHRCKMHWIPGLSTKSSGITAFLFCKYNPKGIRPIESIEKIEGDKPILIVCCVPDMVVPVWSSINLYISRYNQGNKNTYLLVFPRVSMPSLSPTPFMALSTNA